MKNTLITIAASVALAIFTISFTAPAKAPMLQAKGEGHEKVSEKLFIDDAFFKKYKLEASARAIQRIHDWTNMVDKDNKYAVVNDIRWEFDKPEQALDYYQKNLTVNSQKGVELKGTRINIPGVTELHIYKESASIENLNKDLGISTMEYGYLFVVDKVVAKVWVKVNGDVKVDEAALFAKEAASTIHKALGK